MPVEGANPRGGELIHLRQPSQPEPDAGPRRSDVDGWGRSQRVRDVFARLYEPLYRHWFRVEWEGLDKVPTDGGALLVANHAGAIPVDAPLLMHGIETELGRPVYGLADRLFRTLPVAGTIWARAGGVAAHPDNAYRLLHDERALTLDFPEGTKGTGKLFTERYQLQRFGRGGFVEIAMRAGVPVVPIAVMGSEETMPTIARFEAAARLLGVPYVPLTANMLLLGPLGLFTPFPAKIRFRVLDPVRFDVKPDQPRYPKGRVHTEAEAIRAALQQALNDMLAARQSVWLG
ncbi:MAG: acyltransferase family protein [Acidimicrobiaceae bacterium]|nr:acyltransferase family protein [Acidimicrobiaceae bacterium]